MARTKVSAIRAGRIAPPEPVADARGVVRVAALERVRPAVTLDGFGADAALIFATHRANTIVLLSRWNLSEDIHGSYPSNFS